MALTVIAKIQDGKLYKMAQAGEKCPSCQGQLKYQYDPKAQANDPWRWRCPNCGDSSDGGPTTQPTSQPQIPASPQAQPRLPFTKTGLPSVDERKNADFGQFNHTPDQYLADWQKAVHKSTLAYMNLGQPGGQKEMVQYFQGKVGEIDNYIKNNPNLTPEQLNRLRSEKYNLMTHAEAYRRNIGMGGGADLNKYYNSYMQNQEPPQSPPGASNQNAMVSQIMPALTSPRSWGEYQAPSRMSEQEVFNLVKSRMGNNAMIPKLIPGQAPPPGR